MFSLPRLVFHSHFFPEVRCVVSRGEQHRESWNHRELGLEGMLKEVSLHLPPLHPLAVSCPWSRGLPEVKLLAETALGRCSAGNTLHKPGHRQCWLLLKHTSMKH